MPSLRALLVLALLFTGSVEAQNRMGAAALEGAWSRIESGPAATPMTRNPTGPGVMLFVDGHYSWVYVPGIEPRPPVPGPNGTAAELRAVWEPMTAEAGTYDVTGQTMTRRRIVSKNPPAMASGVYATYNWELKGDSLWVTNIATQTGPVADANRNRTKYVRLPGTDTGALRGAWSFVDLHGLDGALTGNQPGMRLFVDGHYAWVRVNGTAPRMAVDSTSTAEQIRATWGGTGLTASSGRYAVIGNVFVQSAIVAMNPTGMQGGNFAPYIYRMVGDSLSSATFSSVTGIGGPGRYIRVRARSAPTN